MTVLTDHTLIGNGYQILPRGEIVLREGHAFDLVDDLQGKAIHVIMDCGADFFVTSIPGFTFKGYEGEEYGGWACSVLIGRGPDPYKGTADWVSSPLFSACAKPIQYGEPWDFDVDIYRPGHELAQNYLRHPVKCERRKQKRCRVETLGFVIDLGE